MRISSPKEAITSNPKVVTILALIVILVSSLGLSRMVGDNEIVALVVLLGSAVFIFAFIYTDFAISLLILSMLLSPEFTFGDSTVHGTHSSVVIRIDDLLLGLITLSWLAKVALNKDMGVFIKTPMNKPIFAYLVVSLFATVLGMFLGNVKPLVGLLYNVKYFQYFLIFFMVTSYLKRMKTLKRYLRLLFITAFVVTIYAIVQIPSGVRVSSPFEGEGGEANTLGGYLVIIMFLVIGMMTGVKKKTTIFGLGLFLILMLIPFAYTLSRSSWLAFFPAIVTMIIISKKRNSIILVLVLIAAISPIFMPRAVLERVDYTFSKENEMREDVVDFGETSLDPSTSMRIQSWSLTLKQWMERPILGWGVTGAGFKDAQFFRVLAETGIVGLSLFIWVLVGIFKTAKQSLARIEESHFPVYHGILVGFIASYFGLLTHAIGANTFIIVRIMEPFWFMMAVVVILPDLLEKEKEEQDFRILEQMVKLEPIALPYGK